jgi:hypothetical protein
MLFDRLGCSIINVLNMNILKNIYYSFVIICFLLGRHFLLISTPNNAYFYGQTLEEFIFVCFTFLALFSAVFSILCIVNKYYKKQYENVLAVIVYLSLIPLVDYGIEINVVKVSSVLPRYIRLIYPLITLSSIPLILLIFFKYNIGKNISKVIVMISFVCPLIIYSAVPRSFSVNLIENQFSFQKKFPVHMIVLDGLSYEILNDTGLKHLFPNINNLLAGNSYVFRDARVPGYPTIDSIPKFLTGVDYETFRFSEKQDMLVAGKDGNYKKLEAEGSLFEITKSYGYNNVLLGTGLAYCNMFGEYLTYGKIFPNSARMTYGLPLAFQVLSHTKYIHFAKKFDNTFSEYLSKIDSSPLNTYFFIHFLTPHAPLAYDYDGWVDQYWNVLLKGTNYNFKERYIEQVRFVDRKIGEILVKLKDRKLYDQSMIILISDHNNRMAGLVNDDEYMTKVPMFIKTPFQDKQFIVKERVELIRFKKLFYDFFQSQITDVDIKAHYSSEKMLELLQQVP